MTRIDIIREAEDALSRQVWYFWLRHDSDSLMLDEYYFDERPTPRHKWRTAGHFRRTNRRSENTIQIEAVPYDEQLAAEARRRFCEMVSVTKGEAEYTYTY